MRRYSLFFSLSQMCALFLVFLSMLQVYNFSSDHPLQPGTTLALGSRDLGRKKELKPKAAGEFFRGWDEEYGSCLGVTGTRGKEEEGGKG